MRRFSIATLSCMLFLYLDIYLASDDCANYAIIEVCLTLRKKKKHFKHA